MKLPPHRFPVFVLGVSMMLATATCAGEESVRRAGVAGTWYTLDAQQLRKEIDEALRAAKPPAIEGRLTALVVPHAGYRYSGGTAAFAYRLLQGTRFERVVVLGPSHYTGFRGFAIAEADAWETPIGRVRVDAASVAALRKDALSANPGNVHSQEHSLEAQIPFLQVALGEFTIVPILIGQNSEEDLMRIADSVRPLLDEKTLLVASSDFTHYGARFGYTPFRTDVQSRIHDLDMGGIDRITSDDAEGFALHIETTRDTVCGADPITVLLNSVTPGSRGALLHYDTSGSMTGDWSTTVSYAAIAIAAPAAGPLAAEPPALPPPVNIIETGAETLGTDERQQLLGLARATLKSHLMADSTLSRFLATFHPTRILRQHRGVFVTIGRTNPDEVRRYGRLRGCIGDIMGSESLYRGVIHNAINAASHDPRFAGMDASELDRVDLEISVLEKPQPVMTAPQVMPGKHGVLLDKGGRRAVFLPQVATEQGWEREELLDNLCRKAGLGAGCWREGARLSVFTAQVFGEKKAAE